MTISHQHNVIEYYTVNIYLNTNVERQPLIKTIGIEYCLIVNVFHGFVNSNKTFITTKTKAIQGRHGTLIFLKLTLRTNTNHLRSIYTWTRTASICPCWQILALASSQLCHMRKATSHANRKTVQKSVAWNNATTKRSRVQLLFRCVASQTQQRTCSPVENCLAHLGVYYYSSSRLLAIHE